MKTRIYKVASYLTEVLFVEVQRKAYDFFKVSYRSGQQMSILASAPYHAKPASAEFMASKACGLSGEPFSHYGHTMVLQALLSAKTFDDFCADISTFVFQAGLIYFDKVVALDTSKTLASGKSASDWALDRCKSELDHKVKSVFKALNFTYGQGNSRCHYTPINELTKGKYEHSAPLVKRALQVPVSVTPITPYIGVDSIDTILDCDVLDS